MDYRDCQPERYRGRIEGVGHLGKDTYGPAVIEQVAIPLVDSRPRLAYIPRRLYVAE